MSVILPSITMATISTGFLMTFRLLVMNLARQSAAPTERPAILGRSANRHATLVQSAG